MADTLLDLRTKGEALLDAAQDYWTSAHKAGISGACIWLDDTDGRTVIFTRGEYRSTLFANIERLHEPVFHFTVPGKTQEEPST